MIPVLIDHFIAFRSTQLVRVLCKPWDHCYPAVDLPYLGSVTITFCQEMWWEFHHLLIILDILILLAIFVHSLVPVLFSTGIPTMELWRVNSKLLTTLLLWSEWAIVHSKSFANWITILTLVVQPNPYFGRTLQPMFNCVCFPRAYFLISVDLTNVISLFT